MPRASLGVRGGAALVLAACIGVLGTAVYLKPDRRGVGTHEQLIRGPCGLLLTTGLPCPTCGMTTAFAHTVRGQWVRAFWAQPVGLLLCLVTGGFAILAGVAVVRGHWPRIWLMERFPISIMIGFLVVFFAGWAFKIATTIPGTGVGPLPGPP